MLKLPLKLHLPLLPMPRLIPGGDMEVTGDILTAATTIQHGVVTIWLASDLLMLKLLPKLLLPLLPMPKLIPGGDTEVTGVIPPTAATTIQHGVVTIWLASDLLRLRLPLLPLLMLRLIPGGHTMEATMVMVTQPGATAGVTTGTGGGSRWLTLLSVLAFHLGV